MELTQLIMCQIAMFLLDGEVPHLIFSSNSSFSTLGQIEVGDSLLHQLTHCMKYMRAVRKAPMEYEKQVFTAGVFPGQPSYITRKLPIS